MTGKNIDEMRRDVPSTVARSDDKAVRTWKETHDSAVGTYGEGARAHRTAFATLRRTHEKVGNRWEPKHDAGPSGQRPVKHASASSRDTGLSGHSPGGHPSGHRTAKRAPAPGGTRLTIGAVDENAPVRHLREVARELDIPGRSTMRKADLIRAINRSQR
ncbi:MULTISPECIES: ChaB family protein [Protofrankia]|uniref:Rho termination factor-like N-terminal domain-containing protein n=1 Tax=Candidatus Protofrankia datiscae TaxID=2716812 RepID=F8B2S5_9ACTN|nr:MULTISPECIES: ChaB family protein [Protofrankia]AEH07799.1 hypothetical protein FsymDg_0227 [Candidatus Protofrankia datiscae]